MKLYSKQNWTSERHIIDFKVTRLVKYLQRRVIKPNCLDILLIIFEIYKLKVKLFSNVIPKSKTH